MAAQQRRGGLLSVAGSVAGLTLVSRVLGFLRWLVQAATVGTGTVAGAYTTANQLPNTLYEVVVGGVLAATVVPLLSAPIAVGRREEVTATASGLLGLVLAVLTPLSLGLIVLSAPIAALFPTSQGVDPALQHELVASFLRMFALQVPMYGVAVVLTGVLQAHNRFIWPVLTPMLSSLVVMATYGLYGVLTNGEDAVASSLALQVLGWGTTLGVAVLSLPLLWPVHRLGLGLRPTLRLGGAQARRALRLGGAGVWTILAQQVSVLVVLAMARWGGQTGTAAVYQYTQAVYVLPYAVLAVPVATVLYPRLTAAFEARELLQGSPGGTGEDDDVTRLVATSTALVTAVAVAGTATLLAASAAAERFFSFKQVDGMGQALAVLSPGLIGYALIYQVTRVLFAADRSRPAAHATAAGWLTVAVACAACVRLMAPSGGDGHATLVALGVGTTIGMTVAGVSLLIVLARVMGGRVLRATLTALVAGLPVALAVGLAVRAVTTRVTSLPLAVATAVIGAAAATALVLVVIHLADRSLLASARGLRATVTTTDDKDQGSTVSGVDSTNEPRAVQGRYAGRRRILQVCGSATGGVRAHLADCARILAADGHDVIVEAPAAVLNGLDVEPARAETLEIGPRPSPNDTLAVARLRRLGRRADVVHAHGLRAGALAALALGRRRRGRTRLVVTLHNLTVGGRLTTLVGERLERLIARRADLVLAVSPDLAERSRELGAPRVELAIIPAAPPGHPSQPSPSGTVAPEDVWPQGGARLLTVARLAPQKGLPLLLEAAAILSREVNAGRLAAFTWALAGDGPGGAEAAERITAEQLPITLLGRRSDAPALMEAADIVVQTSLWEGQPLTIQEALRAGAAIVATDVGGTAVTARGGAVLVAPQAQAIAEAVGTLLSDSEARSRAVERAHEAAGRIPGLEDLAAQLRQAVLDPH